MRSIWTVISLALITGFALALTKHWTQQSMLALVAVILIGAILPMLALGILGTSLLLLVLRNPQIFSLRLVDALQAVNGMLSPGGQKG